LRHELALDKIAIQQIVDTPVSAVNLETIADPVNTA
jgi:hypothetical protein